MSPPKCKTSLSPKGKFYKRTHFLFFCSVFVILSFLIDLAYFGQTGLNYIKIYNVNFFSSKILDIGYFLHNMSHKQTNDSDHRLPTKKQYTLIFAKIFITTLTQLF